MNHEHLSTPSLFSTSYKLFAFTQCPRLQLAVSPIQSTGTVGDTRVFDKEEQEDRSGGRSRARVKAVARARQNERVAGVRHRIVDGKGDGSEGARVGGFAVLLE